MRKNWIVTGSILMALCFSTTSWAATSSYLNQSEYSDIMYDNYTEDRGIVVENRPQLGYLVYKNNKGKEVTRNYYSGEIEVEKQPYYESEDRIGYLDELFPNFSYDPRDTSVSNIKKGDCIYIRMNQNNEITYISAYNDYLMRYGKVISFNYNTGDMVNLQLQDEKGNIYYYEVPLSTPVTKGKKSCALSSVKAGDWVRVLVSQKILGEGITEEEALEIVVDNDTRTISGVYRGQVTSADTFRKILNLKSVQKLGKNSWSAYNDLIRLSMDANNAEIYQNGNRVSADYLNRYMVNNDGYVYVAAENYKGKESAVKLNFQNQLQTTLNPSTVIATTLTSVKLLSGQNLSISQDSIIVRDNRLVDASSIMVGDSIQAVVSQGNKLAVGVIGVKPQGTGTLSVYRGRIKKIADNESFQVETFSMLDGNTWYYYPTPQTFTIDGNTRFYTSEGMQENGVKEFLAYGEKSHVGDVYTIIASGEQASMIIDMPYVTESVKGEVYEVDDKSAKIKDVYYYDTKYKKWVQYSKKNTGATLDTDDNTVIIKNGKVVSASALEKGDVITAMVSENLKTKDGNVKGYIIEVQN